MNNKGFTLIELLATIAILSLLMALLIPNISIFANKIRENHRKSIINNIEIAAAKYAYDTKETLVFVDTLIKNGYLDSDDDDSIIDPLNNMKMNCYLVEMTKEKNYYTAQFIDGESYEANGECDSQKLNNYNEDINIDIINNGASVLNTNAWLKGTVSLSAFSNTVNIDCSSSKCLWHSSSGASKSGVSNILIDDIKGILQTRYSFEYIVLDGESKEIKRYNKIVNLKIDNESPVIYENEIKVSNKFVNTKTKEVTIEASDGNGSGIKEYFMGIVPSGTLCTSNSILNKYQSNNKFIVSANGNYLICVKDTVGNISSTSYIINHIEN